MKNFFALMTLFLTAFSSLVFGQVDIQTNGGLNYTGVLVSGSTSEKYDIVFVGDGFRDVDQAAFNTAVNQAVQALRDLQPYGGQMCSFNIWRVNVLSTDVGVDHPRQGIFRNTELDCRYGNAMEAERCITTDSPAKCVEAASYAPAADATFVLVNDQQWGGCAGGLVFSSISAGFAGIITHELGHKIANLADEYDCYMCDGSDDNRTYVGPEPTAVNLTINTNRSTIKWRTFINASTPLPTTSDVPAGVVGLWEGGGYNRFGIFRPQNNCQMRNLATFCAACNREMTRVLRLNCSFCEANPGSFFCAIRDRLDRFIVYDPLCIFRWGVPLCPRCPVCLTCPFEFDPAEKIEIVLEGIDSRNFKVQVVNADNKVITTGETREKGVQLSFSRRAREKLYVEVSPISKDLVGKQFSVKTKMLVNNKEMRLY